MSNERFVWRFILKMDLGTANITNVEDDDVTGWTKSLLTFEKPVPSARKVSGWEG